MINTLKFTFCGRCQRHHVMSNFILSLLLHLALQKLEFSERERGEQLTMNLVFQEN